jgi:hypothetical protein
MATTTNYGWTTPDDTALVKDGASAIRTLGSSVDTTTKALNPSTTLGDIEYRSSTANTNTRLGIGTTGQVLAVSGGVPAWTTVSSGSLSIAQIATGSLNTGTSLTISSLTQDFIQIQLRNLTWGTNPSDILFQLNGDSSALYSYSGFALRPGDSSGVNATAGSGNNINMNYGYGQRYDNNNNSYVLTLQNCKATGFTTFTATAGSVNDSFVAGTQVQGIYRSAAQITSVRILNANLFTFNGSGTYTVWGG